MTALYKISISYNDRYAILKFQCTTLYIIDGLFSGISGWNIARQIVTNLKDIFLKTVVNVENDLNDGKESCELLYGKFPNFIMGRRARNQCLVLSCPNARFIIIEEIPGKSVHFRDDSNHSG